MDSRVRAGSVGVYFVSFQSDFCDGLKNRPNYFNFSNPCLAELDQVSADLSSAQSQLQQASDLLKNGKIELEQTRLTLAETEKIAKNSTDEISALREEISEFESKNSKLVESEKQLETKYSEAVERTNSIQKYLENVEKELEEKENSIQSLISDAQQKQGERDLIISEREKFAEKTAAAENSISKLLENLKTTKEENKNLAKKLKIAQKGVKGQNVETTKLLAERESLLLKVSSLENIEEKFQQQCAQAQLIIIFRRKYSN